MQYKYVLDKRKYLRQRLCFHTFQNLLKTLVKDLINIFLLISL